MSSRIPQNLFLNDSTVITVVKCNEDALDAQYLRPLLGATCPVLGIAATYGERCQLSSIAFSTLSHVLVVNVPANHIPQPQQAVKQQQVAKSRGLIQACVLLNPEFEKYAFRMDQLAIALYLDLSIRISDAVDMLSVSAKDSRQSLQALTNAMGGEANLRKKNVQSLFFNTPASPAFDAVTAVALKAWAACRAAILPHMSSRFATLPRINTMAIPDAHLATVASISRHADRLEALKPTTTKNDVTDQCSVKKGGINVQCSRFPTRIKNTGNQVIQVELKGKKTTTKVTGRACKVNGRSAQITVNGAKVQGKKIVSVTTVGKENPTFAETTREAVVLGTLQHRTNILSNPFFQAFWLAEERPTWLKPKVERGTPPPVYFPRGLNASQRTAVQRILSDKDDDRIVVIHGPPGTGKTTVIAASVLSHDHTNSNRGIWVAAQSNVGVKNIAEKLVKEGFRKFRLLVSKDFHYDWHKHLYEELEPRLIRSDKFKTSAVEASKLLLGCKIILCTLSMISNPDIGGFLRVIPMEMIILDEASQIECGNYLPIFHHFRSSLSKVVLIGDDKQLPPYGQEDIQELRSVFEFSHLRRRALFLDTQYRMPHVVGTFISRNVYDGKLRTDHNSTTSKACRIIDVTKGQEAKAGHSWVNREEARVVAKLVRMYKSKNVSFRIITPYDAQRAHIENTLKSEKLPWEDTVFNVDSFQGNEDDHIIVSVVRSHGPGFLRNERRTNVMLTRCKQSMVICSSRVFLFRHASETLVGKLAASIDKENWIDGHDVLCGRVNLFA